MTRGVEIGLAQRAAAPVLQALVERGTGAELLALGGVGEQLVLDQVLDQHPAPGGFGQVADVRADLGLGKLEVALGQRLAVDLGNHLVLSDGDRGAGQHRQGQGGEERLAERGRVHVGSILEVSVKLIAAASARVSAGHIDRAMRYCQVNNRTDGGIATA